MLFYLKKIDVTLTWP